MCPPYRAAVGLSDETAIPLVSSNLYQNRARLLRAQGQLDEATQYASKSIGLAKAAYNTVMADTTQASTYSAHYYAQALHVGALVQEDMNNPETANQLFERAVLLAEHSGLERVHEEILYSFAMVLKARGDWAGAMQPLQKATWVRKTSGTGTASNSYYRRS